jgi:hypothetical protein
MSKCCLAQSPTAVPYDPAASGAIVSNRGRSLPVKASSGWVPVDKGLRGARGQLRSSTKSVGGVRMGAVVLLYSNRLGHADAKARWALVESQGLIYKTERTYG